MLTAPYTARFTFVSECLTRPVKKHSIPYKTNLQLIARFIVHSDYIEIDDTPKSSQYKLLCMLEKALNGDLRVDLSSPFFTAGNTLENQTLKKELEEMDNVQKLGIEAHKKTCPRKIALPFKKGYIFATLNEIVRIEGEANYSTFYFTSGEKLLITKCLGAYEKLLQNDYFFRTHKRHIVNLNYVASFERGRCSMISLNNGHGVPLSRARRQNFIDTLKLETIF